MGIVRGIGAVWLAACVATGCGTSATITRNDGTLLEGWIQGGTQDSIIVEPRSGRRQEILRSEISDIDHPGNVHVLVGGIVFAYGGILAGTTAEHCTETGDNLSGCVLGFVPVLAGAGILTWGLVTWLGSKETVKDRSSAHIRPEKLRWRERRPTAPLVDDASAPPAVVAPVVPSVPAPAPSGSGPAAPGAETPAPAPAPEAPQEPPQEPPPGVTW